MRSIFEQALLSALDQGLPPAELEIVAVDDGSTDRTPSIVQKFVPQVKYLKKKNGGQASAFNAAFPQLSGQVVSLFDGDDCRVKGKLSPLIDALEQNPKISAAAAAFYEVEEATRDTQICVPQETKEVHLGTQVAAHETTLYWVFLRTSTITTRRETLIEVVPIPKALIYGRVGRSVWVAAGAGLGSGETAGPGV